MNEQQSTLTSNERIAELEKLLREAMKIIHAHARPFAKDWRLRPVKAMRKDKS